MLRLLTDEDVHGDIIRGLLRRIPNLDLERVQGVGLDNTPDPEILAWAAQESRILITADVNSMIGHAWDRVHAGDPMPGVLALRTGVSIGIAISDIVLAVECYTEVEIQNQVIHIPL